jgi:hypothetical protein
VPETGSFTAVFWQALPARSVAAFVGVHFVLLDTTAVPPAAFGVPSTTVIAEPVAVIEEFENRIVEVV